MDKIRELLAKLAEIEWTSELIENLKKELEVLESKSKWLEEKNKEIQELKSKIEVKEEELKSKEEEIEKLKTEGASQTDWFKTLYEQKKSRVEILEAEVEKLRSDNNEYIKLKEVQETKFAEEIDLLYKQVPEDKKEFVKSMASKYPLEERISFITDFLENFWIIVPKDKSQWGKPKNWTIESEMTDARKMFEEISKIPAHHRTDKQKRDFITLGKILDWTISLES